MIAQTDHERKHQASSSPTLTVCLYFFFVLSLTLYGFFRPQPTWDLLGYVGAVITFAESDTTVIHGKTYELARQNLSTEDFLLLAYGNEYRLHVSSDARSFVQQLPWYKIKPLYTALAYALSKTGLNIVFACLLISLASFVFCSALMFHWLRGRVESLLLLVASPLIFIAADLPSVGRLATPDALSAALLLAALYVLVEKKSISGFFALILLSILARPDKVIPALALLIWLAFFSPAELRIGLKRLVLLAGILAGLVVSVQVISGTPGWGTLFHHAFIGEIYYPADQPVNLSISNYALALGRGIRDLVFRMPDSSFAFFGVLTLLLYLSTRSTGRRRIDVTPAYLMVLSIVIQFLLYPFAGAMDRFFLGQHLFIGIVCVLTIQSPQREN